MTLIGTKSTSPQAQTEAATARDPRTFWRVGLALALPIGPLLVTFARAIMPYWPLRMTRRLLPTSRPTRGPWK
jgi:hypothetical protein